LIIVTSHYGKDCIEVGIPFQPPMYVLKQGSGIPAVVIRKADNLAAGSSESSVSCPADTTLTSKMAHGKAAMPSQHLRYALIGVLINDDDLKIAVGLGIKAC